MAISSLNVIIGLRKPFTVMAKYYEFKLLLFTVPMIGTFLWTIGKLRNYQPEMTIRSTNTFVRLWMILRNLSLFGFFQVFTFDKTLQYFVDLRSKIEVLLGFYIFATLDFQLLLNMSFKSTATKQMISRDNWDRRIQYSFLKVSSQDVNCHTKKEIGLRYYECGRYYIILIHLQPEREQCDTKKDEIVDVQLLQLNT